MTGVDWFVPGVGIDEGDHTVRLRPAEDWVRFILELPRTPPSMNTNVGRGHWRSFQKEKRSWQEEIEVDLMIARASREGYRRALAGAFCRFPVHRKQRDPSNFATVVNKSLGDALVTYGVIPDDDAVHYLFGGIEIEEEIGPPRTRIFLYVQPKEG